MADHNLESEFVAHGPCEACGSSDAKGIFTDGHTFCFSCSVYEKGDTNEGGSSTALRDTNEGGSSKAPRDISLLNGDYAALSKRGISEATCRKFGYQIGTYKGQPVQIAPFHDATGRMVAQHIRFPNKDFVWLGKSKQSCLWGQQLWRDTGKMVVITEGEIDCMSISQLQDNRWPVVSIRSGAQGAPKDIAHALEWLNGFESVIFAFDMDDPGRAASIACAQLLEPGKAKIWTIPLKDANEMLVDGRYKEILDAVWGAKQYRPDGIVSGADTWDLLMEDDADCIVPYPWQGLNAKTLGMRGEEIVTFCAGSGVGKSQVCRELAVHLITHGEKVGVIALEESVKKSIRGLVSIVANAKLHISEVRKGLATDTLKAAWDTVAESVFFYDHWGSLDGDNLFSRIRFFARACGCRWIVLDHLSIVVSGDEDGDERRKIDNLMTKLRSLVEELKIGMLLVSHLKRPDGKPLEEGGRTSLSLLRGSGSIGQLSDIVVGQERNQQDEERSNITTLRVLKNRFNGETGLAGELSYDAVTGRLLEYDESSPFNQKDDYGKQSSHANASF